MPTKKYRIKLTTEEQQSLPPALTGGTESVGFPRTGGGV